MRLVEIDDYFPILRHVRVEESARGVSLLARGLVPEGEEELVVFDRRFETPGLAAEFEFSVTGSGVVLRHAQDIGDGNLVWRIVGMPTGMNPVASVDREPVQSGELASCGAVRIAQAHAGARTPLDHGHGEAAQSDHVGVFGDIGLERLAGGGLAVDQEMDTGGWNQPRYDAVKVEGRGEPE